MIGNTGKQGKEKTKPLLTLGKARNCRRKVIRIQYMAQLWIMFICSYNVILHISNVDKSERT